MFQVLCYFSDCSIKCTQLSFFTTCHFFFYQKQDILDICYAFPHLGMDVHALSPNVNHFTQELR